MTGDTNVRNSSSLRQLLDQNTFHADISTDLRGLINNGTEFKKDETYMERKKKESERLLMKSLSPSVETHTMEGAKLLVSCLTGTRGEEHVIQSLGTSGSRLRRHFSDVRLSNWNQETMRHVLLGITTHFLGK
tara:strand:+ start:140 stop:538 length:399 start_codon:yes stop_codon:yes gene_type:complete